MTGGAAAGCPVRALHSLSPGPNQAEALLMAGRATTLESPECFLIRQRSSTKRHRGDGHTSLAGTSKSCSWAARDCRMAMYMRQCTLKTLQSSSCLHREALLKSVQKKCHLAVT